jgi:hypothetical protein
MSKSRRSSNKRCGKLGLGTPHDKTRVAPTHKTKDRENMENLRTTKLSHKQRRTLEKQRKISGSGANSIRVPNITLVIATKKQSLVAEVKDFELDVGFESELGP